MQFIAADNTTITLNNPVGAYSVALHMPITIPEKHPAGYGPAFDADNSGALDYRIIDTATWKLPAAQKAALNGFFRDAALGRAETVKLRLGSTSTGFFPGGPDLGDVGDFTVRVVSQDQGGMLLEPWKYWQDTLALVIVTAPSYTPEAGAAQGSLTIGTVDGLMYPQAGFNAMSRYNLRTDLSRSGVPYSVDGRVAADAWESEWLQRCNNGLAAELVEYLATARGGDIDIVSAPNYWVYGADNLAEASYSSRFLGSSRTRNDVVLKMTCEKYNHWSIPLRFALTEINVS
jgi:hypothetical protein